MNSISISNKSRTLEISAVLLTALGKFLFMDCLNWRLPFILSAIFFWSFYVFYRSKMKPGIKAYWGFRTDNLKSVLRFILPFGITSVIIFLFIGLYQHSIIFTWHIVPILILYPLWGVIQQFLLIALTVGNLKDYDGSPFNKSIILVLPALLFAVIHYPYTWLMLGTFILAIFYGRIFLKERNIYALGIFHGWLGAIFFYTVVGRDPLLEIFGGLMYLAK
jgi:hypothetical protein